MVLREQMVAQKNVFCNTRTIQCVTHQSTIAARQSSGTENSRSSIGNVVLLQSCFPTQDRKILLHRIPESEPSFDSLSSDSSWFIEINSSPLLVLPDKLLRNKYCSTLDFLIISCMIFLEESTSQCQLSIQADFLSGTDLPIDLLGEVEIDEFQILAEPIFLLGRLSQLSLQRFFGDFLSPGMHSVRVSVYLFPFDCEKSLLQLILCPKLRQFPGGLYDPTHDLPSVSKDLRSEHRRNSLLAVCLLLDAPECGKPSGSSKVEITVPSSWHWKSWWLSVELIGVCSVSM